MADVIALLQGRIIYLEQENAYLMSLLERYYKIVSLIKEKEES